MTLKDYERLIKNHMGEKRFIHSVNVSKEASRLADKYGADVHKAEIAGILHDITKEMPFDDQLQMIESNGIILSDIKKTAPKLWHSISGFLYIKNELGIIDEDILNAVRYHTTGRKNMSLLEKVIFVADFTGAERDYNGVDVMRKKADKSLEEAMLFGVSFSIIDLTERQLTIDPNTFELYNQLIINK